MSEELIYLTRCCHLIEEKWQRGESKFWKNGDYQKLIELVSTTTCISIRPDTFKRLFGKIETYRSYNPQLETKNALAIFIGYEGWEDFKKRQPVLAGEGRLPVPVALPAPGLSPPGGEAVAVAPVEVMAPAGPVAVPSPLEAAWVAAESPRPRARRGRYGPVVWGVLGIVVLAGWYWLAAPREGRRPAEAVAAGPASRACRRGTGPCPAQRGACRPAAA